MGGDPTRVEEHEILMSRAWDSIKETAHEKARAALGGQPERRRSDRAIHRVSLLLYGSDSEKEPFHEEAFTLEVNDAGCLLSVSAEVVSGQRLVLTNLRNQAEQECRVIRVGKRVHGKTRIAVQFLHPDPDFWLDE